uniref:C-type lectin 4 n=1 Tax=Agkistrodon contortrix contortrix TaxID=8713 RepID=A0A1W7RK05_AGKCO
MGRFIFMSFGLLVVFLSLSGTGADLFCPSGWDSNNDHCYKVFNQRKNWEDAERFCSEQANGGHLVSIESAREADFVAQLLSEKLETSSHYVWIGLRDERKEQPEPSPQSANVASFKQCSSEWSDGSSVSYENLAERETKKCFMLKKWAGFRTWDNVYCGKQNPFICKSPPQWEDPAE